MPAPRVAPRRELTGTRQGDDAQRVAIDVARRFNLLPFGNGKRIDGVVFAAGTPKTIAHGLGRRPTSYLVLRSYGANVCTGVGESTTQPSDVTKSINLQTVVACTVDLWVSVS